MNVVHLEKPAATVPDIRTLDGRYHCLIKYQGHLVSAVLCNERLSPSRNYIQIGDYYSDQLRKAWYPVDEIQVVEVIKKVEPATEAKRPWWKRVLRGRA